MIQVICDSCHAQVLGFGALIVSPPNADGKHDEFQICNSCYNAMLRFMFDGE